MSDLDTKAALPDDIAVALDHGAITERDAADEMAKRLRAAVAEVGRLETILSVARAERDAAIAAKEQSVADEDRQLIDHKADLCDAVPRAALPPLIRYAIGEAYRRARFDGAEGLDAATAGAVAEAMASVDAGAVGDWREDLRAAWSIRERLRADNERLESQAAALRAALLALQDWSCSVIAVGEKGLAALALADAALVPDAGRAILAERDGLRADVARLTGERDKALADRKVLVEALRLVVAFDRARQHPDETGRISVPRLNEILWKCADALRAVGEEP